MDDEEYEAFDFNPTDIEYAIDPSRRRRNRQTREERIFGIWADKDEVEAEVETREPKKDYSLGVAFVSAGSTAADGSSAASSSSMPPPKKPRTSAMAFGSGLNRPGEESFAGLRTGSSKGFSSKILNMMKKMGHEEGKGLGASRQGIVEPIQAAVRQGRGGIGAYGREASAVGPRYGESATESEAREQGEHSSAEQPTLRRGFWKKNRRGQQPQSDASIKTLDEVLADRSNDASVPNTSLQSEAPLKIIDMTGRQQRVYNDFSSFSRKTKDADVDSYRTNFNIPELVSNLTSLLDVTEDEVRRADRQKKSLKDQNVALAADAQEIRKAISDQECELKRIATVVQLVDDFKAQAGRSIDSCKKLLLTLKKDYVLEYKLYGLDSLALATVMPLMQKHFSEWKVLEPGEEDYGLDLVNEWLGVLEGDGAQKTTKSTFDRCKSELDALPAFDRCLWDAWMPAVRRATLDWHVPTQSHAMKVVIATWLPLLPDWIVENLFEQVIVPRIKEFVDSWDPTKARIPIDAWVLPWHEMLGHRLMSVYPIIRQKLAKALKNWVVTDSSALNVISPWKDAFTKQTMSSFLSINIVPKLEVGLLTMNLNPTENFEYLEFQALLSWRQLIGLPLTCQVLLKAFFPRWLDNLVTWLTAPGVVLREVAAYYVEWRGRLPPELIALQPIEAELRRALELINQAKKNLPIYLVPATSFLPAPPPPPPPPQQQKQFNVPGDVSMKEFIEDYSARMGLEFLPLPGQTYEGLPVYKLGDQHLVAFSRNDIFACDVRTKAWDFARLETLFHG